MTASKISLGLFIGVLMGMLAMDCYLKELPLDTFWWAMVIMVIPAKLGYNIGKEANRTAKP